MAQFVRKPADESPDPSSGEHRIAASPRRRDVRIESSLAVLVQAPGREVAGIATNIGLGGMFVRTTETLPYATAVSVRFGRLDVGLELHLPATVRWVTALGFGLQFGPLGARETHALLLLLTAP